MKRMSKKHVNQLDRWRETDGKNCPHKQFNTTTVKCLEEKNNLKNKIGGVSSDLTGTNVSRAESMSTLLL